eukprot:263350_1
MTITNITDVQATKLVQYTEWIASILYFERIIEQTMSTRDQYNHGVITKTQTVEKWKDRQREYLVPLIKNQMTKNLERYEEYLDDTDIYLDDEKNQNSSKPIPEYVSDLFQHFCDSKKSFIDLSCIMLEAKQMDMSLLQLLFKITANKDYIINNVQISSIFPKVKQYKNHHNEWVPLPSLKEFFQQIADKKKLALEVDTLETKPQSETINIIQQIDECLSRYYESFKRKDYVKNGVGKFQLYCDENGFSNADIDEELNNARDCTLVDMDDNFPLQIGTLDGDKKNEAIFNIILICKTNPDAFKGDGDEKRLKWAPKPEFFEIDDILFDMVKAKYEKQCNLIWNLGTKAGADKSLVTVLAIGQKHGFPYLQYLVDMYIRDKITFKVKHKKMLPVDEWAQANYYMQEVKNMDIQTNQKYYKILSSAVSVFCHRVCPQIQLENIRQVKDDTWKIADWIYAVTRFASESNAPSQMDFCMILESTNDEYVDEKDDNSDDDDDDD